MLNAPSLQGLDKNEFRPIKYIPIIKIEWGTRDQWTVLFHNMLKKIMMRKEPLIFDIKR